MKNYDLKNANWDESGLLHGLQGIMYDTVKKSKIVYIFFV